MPFNHDRSAWTDPDTGTTYDLGVFKPFTTTYEIKPRKDAEPFSVEVLVRFSNHCYSRTRKGEAEHHIIDTQQHRNGMVDERVFCVDRWTFCQNVRTVIDELALKRCLEGGSKEILYRQEQPSQVAAHDGWYLCMRLEHRKGRTPPLSLSVRSVHWRTNRPADIRRHGGQKFREILSRFAKSKGL